MAAKRLRKTNVSDLDAQIEKLMHAREELENEIARVIGKKVLDNYTVNSKTEATKWFNEAHEALEFRKDHDDKWVKEANAAIAFKKDVEAENKARAEKAAEEKRNQAANTPLQNNGFVQQQQQQTPNQAKAF